MVAPNNLELSLTHKLLLQAALQEGDKATNAWQKWITTVDIENLDDESYYLLSLLYRNLVKHQIEHQELTRLKGVSKRNWYHNQLQVTALTTILNSFIDAKIKNIVLGDAALATNYYNDLGVRLIHSIDLLIAAEDALTAYQLLCDSGWKSKVNLTPKFMALYPKIGLQDNSGKICHLYWRYWGESFSKHNLLNDTCNIKINEVSGYILKPESQLLGIAWQGCISESNCLVRWLADLYQILQLYHQKIDCKYVIKKAENYSLTLFLTMLFNHFEQTFELSLNISQDLAIKSSTIEAIEKLVNQTPKLPIFLKINRKLLSYFRLVDHHEFPLTIFGLIKYLQISRSVF